MYGVWYSIYSVVVKFSKVTVMVGQNRYSKLKDTENPCAKCANLHSLN